MRLRRLFYRWSTTEGQSALYANLSFLFTYWFIGSKLLFFENIHIFDVTQGVHILKSEFVVPQSTDQMYKTMKSRWKSASIKYADMAQGRPLPVVICGFISVKSIAGRPQILVTKVAGPF